jgi:hypothetical protein
MVNLKGFYCDKQGSIVDSQGNKKIDKRFKDLPRLYTLEGQLFDVKDVIGDFVKDTDG